MKKCVIGIFICIVLFGNTNGNYLNFAKNYIKNEVISVIEKAGENSQCTKDLKSVILNLIYGKKWAWEMIDASAKLQSGIMNGNIFHVGNYEQCLKVRSDNENNTNIQGQYCTVVLVPNENVESELSSILLDTKRLSQWIGIRKSRQIPSLIQKIKYTFGVCIPLSCSISNLQKIWDYIEFTFGSSIHAVFVDSLCSHEGKIPVQSSYDKYIFGFFALVIGIVFLSTLYDFYYHQKKAEGKDNYLMIFSAYTNTKRLIYGNNSQSKDKITCLNGIKVLSMIWVIVGHRFMYNILSGNINFFDIFEWREDYKNIPILAATLSVDVFLALSGLLLSYLFLTKKQDLTVMQLYTYRFLRLSPCLIAVILLYIGVLKHLNDGPAWNPLTSKMATSCTATWWSTLLFLTNFLDPMEQCVEHGWYLAVDTQLYFVSPIILFSLVKHPKRTLFGMGFLLICSITYAFVITVKYDYGAALFEARPGYYKNIYLSTFVRGSVWLIGIFFGYFMVKCKQIRIPKHVNILLWIYVFGSMYYLMYFHLLFIRLEYNPIVSGLFNALIRPLWGLSTCLMVFLCIKNEDGIVNRFFSHWLFDIPVRLSYCIYLIHISVGIYLVGSKKAVGHLSNATNYHDAIGDIAFSILPAFLLFLTFEAPFNNLSRMLYEQQEETQGNLKKRKEIKDDDNVEDNKYLICVYEVNGKKKKMKKYLPKKVH